jgi:hypothetical protein
MLLLKEASGAELPGKFDSRTSPDEFADSSLGSELRRLKLTFELSTNEEEPVAKKRKVFEPEMSVLQQLLEDLNACYSPDSAVDKDTMDSLL